MLRRSLHLGRRCAARNGFSRVCRPAALRQLSLPATTSPVFSSRWITQASSRLREGEHASSQAAAFSASGDTIYALSTAQGQAGIAVIRISGPACIDVYKALCPSKSIPKPRYAAVRSLYDPDGDVGSNVLDHEALVLYFPAPRTVTGEDVLELHIHGGSATVKATLAAVPRCVAKHLVRYADPGEFTKRAFINNRLDLGQIEALSDVLAAETEQQRRAAIRGSSGVLGRTYDEWRQQLLLARGEIEALIDFSEDQHFDESQSELLQNVTVMVGEMLHSIRMHEQGSQRSELLRNGIRLALLGPPNVGKSSLMNLIVGREASIVSGEAGTTRDIVEASLDIRGYLCSFADTAGFRSRASGEEGPIGAVEQEGIRRARQKALESNVVMVLASVEAVGGRPHIQYDKETLDIASQAEACMVVINKRDAADRQTFSRLLDEFRQTITKQHPKLAGVEVLPISCKRAQTMSRVGDNDDPGGIQKLVSSVAETFATLTDLPANLQDLLGVTERQRQLLVECKEHLADFMAEAQPGGHEAQAQAQARDADPLLAAEHLRYAADCLARITGKGEGGDVEDVLGVVFEKFCVGK
ncbi:hypothetical protein B0I35DRAFT_240401 [Stachybotrys elegans]|uniref:TrmE-type G domain-containing protein n=1 Tax=Stachybotrys elegans TaxID=80388 RepID=A0A8K0SR59_9HYPO|nr:hypothetical protein B0I35DRAFT_240401 [Stachybotrys elegans]